MKKFGCLIGILIGIFIGTVFFLESYVFMLLWNWLAHLFWSAAPILGLSECVGIILLINLIGSALGLNKK